MDRVWGIRVGSHKHRPYYLSVFFETKKDAELYAKKHSTWGPVKKNGISRDWTVVRLIERYKTTPPAKEN